MMTRSKTGDKVLLFNFRLNIFSGKLKSRWSGLFTISEIYPYGTAKLIHPDGCNFKVNRHRLKHYHGGDPPPLEISDVTTFPKDNLIQGSSRAHDSDCPPKIEELLCRILSWFPRSFVKRIENKAKAVIFGWRLDKLEDDTSSWYCSSSRTVSTWDCSCSKGNVEDKILVPKPPKNSARCGHPVNGSYCQGCALLREKLEEDLDHGVKSSQNPPHIDECCCECGNALDGIFCQQCICKSCGKGTHIGYNCPPKVPIISNPEPCNQTMNNELPQTLPSFDSTCYSDKENSVPCVSKPNFVDESSNIFNPPLQPPIYYCEFCGRNAQYGHYCIPQAPFNNPEPGYSQDFNFSQNIHDYDSYYSGFDQFSVSTQEEKRIEEEQAAKARYWKIPACCDDDDDYNSAITPVLSTEEPVDSLSMGDEHLDTISATESDEVIKSSVEDLVPIPSEFECTPDTMCDVHLVNNPTPLEAKDHFEIVTKSNDDISSSDDDSLYNENIEYVEASPHDSEVVSLEVAEIVIPEEEEIEDDNLREELLNVHLLIANIEALKDNPTPSSKSLTKSSSTSSKSFLEETNTFHNSLPEFENFYFDLEELSSGSTTTHFDISLPDYEAFSFNNDHIKEISSGSTTTHSDISLSEYDSFTFDLSNDQCPTSDRSDFTHEEFADELAHIISPPKYDCFYFRDLPDPGELISIFNSRIRENLSSTTCVNLPIKDDHSPLLTYVVWIFLTYLTYPVIPPYLHPFRNEDTIFDPGITINHFYSFKPGLSHRCGAFKKFNTHHSHLNEWPMIINGKNIPILDVLLFHFYPPLINSSMGELGQASGL
nr:reverse transcriptase domain-containing protein [Tanacetum cinerariifolium]